MKYLLATGSALALTLTTIAIPSMATPQSDINELVPITQNIEELDAKIKTEQRKDKSVPSKVFQDEDGTIFVAGNESAEFPKEVLTTDELEIIQKEELSDIDFDSIIATQIQNPETVTIVSLDIEPDDFEEVSVIVEAPPPPPEPEPEPEPEPTYTEETTNNVDPTPPPAVSGSIVETALQYVGYPYVYGAAGPNAFDCSGFTSYIYGLHGISLPRTSYSQANYGTTISADQARPGDLVISNGGGHVMIYLGDGMVVHASTPSTGVKVSSIWGPHWFVRVGG